MVNHILEEAKKIGFQAKQLNIVISTNLMSINLWRDMGRASNFSMTTISPCSGEIT